MIDKVNNINDTNGNRFLDLDKFLQINNLTDFKLFGMNSTEYGLISSINGATMRIDKISPQYVYFNLNLFGKDIKLKITINPDDLTICSEMEKSKDLCFYYIRVNVEDLERNEKFLKVIGADFIEVERITKTMIPLFSPADKFYFCSKNKTDSNLNIYNFQEYLKSLENLKNNSETSKSLAS